MEDKWIAKDKRITKLALMKDLIALSEATKPVQDQYLDVLYIAKQVWPDLEEWLFPTIPITENSEWDNKLKEEAKNKFNAPLSDDDIPVIEEEE